MDSGFMDGVLFYATVILGFIVVSWLWSKARGRQRTMEIRFPEDYEGEFYVAGRVKRREAEYYLGDQRDRGGYYLSDQRREELPMYRGEYDDIPDMRPSRRRLIGRR